MVTATAESACPVTQVSAAGPPQRVIFVNRYFFPDNSATSQMLSDLSFALARSGHAIHVICSRQRYDDAHARLPGTEQLHGVHVHRVRAARFGRARLVGRTVDYLTFLMAASMKLLVVLRRGDIVVAMTDPPMMSVFIAQVATLRKALVVNWLQDIFPEVAEKVGIRGMPVWFMSGLRRMRNLSLRSARLNVVISPRMAAYVVAEGVNAASVTVIANWADHEGPRGNAARLSAMRARLGSGKEFVVSYSGNLGRAHDYRTILEAGTLLATDPGVSFLMIGGGAGMQSLAAEAAKRGLGNFRFIGYQPREQLGDSLAVADVHLVSLRPELEGLIMPSKLYGIMAAGRPAIFVGDPEGETAHVLSTYQCGSAVKWGDSAALVREIRRLRESPALCAAMGERAHAAFAGQYSLPIAAARWLDALASASASQRLPGRAV